MYQASERSSQRKKAERQSFDSKQAWGSPRTGLSKWSDSQGGSPRQRCCRRVTTTFVWWSRKESPSYQFRDTNHRRLQGAIPEENSSFSKDLFFFFLNCTGVLVAAFRFFSSGMWELLPWLEIKSGPPAVGARSLSHWTAREVPKALFKN